jgi:Methyltransferase domain
MLKLHQTTDAWAGELYGRFSHPRNRVLTQAGIGMVAETHHGQMSAIGVYASRLPKMRVLECGGTGRDALAWIKLGAEHVTHVDLSNENIERLCGFVKAEGIDNLTAVRADLLMVDLPQQAFDIVRSRGVLHHLGDPGLGLARYAAWTKVGGLLHFNAYRSGTFYYYGIQQLRRIVGRADVRPVVDALDRLKIASDRAGILLDDLFVPHQHTASVWRLTHDLNALELEVVWPRRTWTEIDHDLRYPDLPEKDEHVQFWLKKQRHVDPDEVIERLCYRRGGDEVEVARGLPEAAVSLKAFERFGRMAEAASAESRAEAIVRTYLAHHFKISTVAMGSAERHRMLAATVDEETRKLEVITSRGNQEKGERR